MVSLKPGHLDWVRDYVFHVNPLNAELNRICHLLALLGAHHIFHVSGLRVKPVYPFPPLSPATYT